MFSLLPALFGFTERQEISSDSRRLLPSRMKLTKLHGSVFFFEKLTGPRLVKKFLAFYGT